MMTNNEERDTRMVTLPDGANVGDGGHVTDHNLIVAALTTHDTQIASVQAQANTSTSKVAALETTVNTTHPARMTAIEATNTTQQTAIDANTAGLAQVGNLLTANQANVLHTEATLAAGGNGAKSAGTVTYNGISYSGTRVTATQDATRPYLVGPIQPATAGVTYTAVALIDNTTGTTSRGVSCSFKNASNASLTFTPATDFRVAAGQVGLATFVAVAPAGTIGMSAALGYGTAVTGPTETYVVARAGVWQGAGGEWALPGTPIVNTGRRVTHPNTDDTLVQIWDGEKGRWQTTHYDSGTRDITSLCVVDAANTGTIRIRRVNNQVVWQLSGVLLPAGTGIHGINTAIPLGFRALGMASGAAHRSNAQSYEQALAWNNTTLYWTGERCLNPFSGTVTRPSVGISGSFVIPTGDAIPTTLPGTNAASAPALLQHDESVDQGTFISPDSDPRPDVFAHLDDGTPIDPPLGGTH